MDENTNVNENVESTTTPIENEAASETSASSFSMPTDPTNTENEAPKPKINEYPETVVMEETPVTMPVQNNPFDTGYSQPVVNDSYSTNYSAPVQSDPYANNYSSQPDPYANSYSSQPDPYANSYSSQPVYGSVEPTEEFTKAFATASLVLGICSIVFSCCCTILGIILAIIGIVLGCIQKPDPMTGKKPGMAIAGIICSSIGIVLCIVSGILGLAFTNYYS